MRNNRWGIIYFILVGLCWVGCAQRAWAEPEVASGKREVRLDVVRSMKAIQGELDSVRSDKVVVTYELEGESGGKLQSFYFRDESTEFLGREAERLKPGDVVTVNFEEVSWKTEEGRDRRERFARSVQFVKSAAAVEAAAAKQVPAPSVGAPSSGAAED